MQEEPAGDTSPKKKPRKSGRKPIPAEKKQRHTVTVRLTDDEYLRLTQQEAQQHLGLGEILRRGWKRHGTGQFLPTVRTAEQAREISALANLTGELHQLRQRRDLPSQVVDGLAGVLSQANAVLKKMEA